MDYRIKAIKNTFWMTCSYFLALPFGYFVRIIYAKNLPKPEIGLFYALLDLFSLLNILRNFGVGTTLSRFIPKFLVENKFSHIKSTILFLGSVNLFFTFLLGFILYFSSSFILGIYFHKNTMSFSFIFRLFLLMLLGFYFFEGLLTYVGSLFQAFQKQVYLSIINVLKSFSIFIFSVLFIYYFQIKNAYSPTLAYSFASFFLFLIFVIIFFQKIFKRFLYIRCFSSINLFKNLLKFSFYILLTSFGTLVLGYVDGICLNIFKGLNVVADYRNVAMPLANLILLICSSFTVVLLPMVSELWERRDLKVLQSAIEKAYLYIFIFALPFSGLFVVFPGKIITFLFGKIYLTATNMLVVLAIGSIFSVFSQLGFTILNGLGKVKSSSKIIYIGAFLNFVLNLLLISRLGGIGASFATAFSYFIMFLLQVGSIKKSIKISLLDKKFLLSFFTISGLLLGLKIINIESFHFFMFLVVLCFYFLLYFLFLIFIDVFDKTDLTILLNYLFKK